jgi:CelD/BcsL family acetyltransferase involved in cellulose biosynthesis
MSSAATSTSAPADGWRIATSVEEASALCESVAALRGRLREASPNADPNRLLAEIGVAEDGASPYVAVFSRAGSVAAAIVARVSRRPIECRFGYFKVPTPSMARLDIVHGGVIADGEAGLSEVTDHLAGVLKRAEFGVIMINRVRADSAAGAALLTWARGRSVVSRDPHWRGVLTDEAGAFRVPVSSKTRGTLRRKERKLAEAVGELTLRVITRAEDVPELTRAAGRITKTSYHHALGVGVRDNPLWQAIGRSMAGGGSLRGYVLYAGERPLAYVFGGVYSGIFTLEATGFDSEFTSLSAGGVLLWRTMSDLVESRIGVVDFGFGDAEYKRMYGTESYEDATIRAYGRGVKALGTHAADAGVVTASRLAVRVLARLGTLKKFKRGWRRQLSKPSTGDDAS